MICILYLDISSSFIVLGSPSQDKYVKLIGRGWQCACWGNCLSLSHAGVTTTFIWDSKVGPQRWTSLLRCKCCRNNRSMLIREQWGFQMEAKVYDFHEIFRTRPLSNALKQGEEHTGWGLNPAHCSISSGLWPVFQNIRTCDCSTFNFR